MFFIEANWEFIPNFIWNIVSNESIEMKEFFAKLVQFSGFFQVENILFFFVIFNFC